MICPKCGQRRFVPYVSTLDGKTLAGSEYGRCDREQSCGYQLYPGKDVNAGDIKPVEVKIEPPLRFYPAAVVTDTGTPLFEYVSKLLGVSRALEIWNRYKIGRDGNRTVFWQIAKEEMGKRCRLSILNCKLQSFQTIGVSNQRLSLPGLRNSVCY